MSLAVREGDTKRETLFGLESWESLSIIAMVMGIITICVVAGSAKPPAVAGWALGASLLLVAFAAAMVGAIIGFLFGVPRFKADNAAQEGTERAAANYSPNTNLEQVSDWLTKVIIGATLVELREVPRGLGALSTQVAQLLGSPPLAAVIGGAIIFFGALGFLWGYLWSSIRILRELKKAAELVRG